MNRILQSCHSIFSPIKCLLLIFTVTTFTGLKAQTDSRISTIVKEVSIDTLTSYVRILSGEDSVRISGVKQLIKSRKPGTESYMLTGDFIRQTLRRFGLNATEQYFIKNISGSNVYVTNILAVQPGTDTTAKYIICAHYDAVTDYCADDNGSGTAAVLEAARLISKIKTDRTVIYAFWDQEEKVLIGSGYYAAKADSIRLNIQGVLNLDMLGWDGNADGRAEIHVRNFSNSVALSNKIYDLNSAYSIGLNTFIVNPGTTASDHSSFWNRNYSAVLLIEAFSGGDFNPRYHSVNDRVSLFNTSYYHKMVKLAVAGILSMASDIRFTANNTEYPVGELSLEQNYPNPVASITTIRFYIPGKNFTSLKIYNSTGYETESLISENLDRGYHQVSWNSGNLPGGIYFYRLQTGANILVRKMVVMR